MELNNHICRAKCKDTGEWIYGYYVKHNTVQICCIDYDPRPKHYIVNDGSACDWGFEPPLQATEVDPDTVCRCLGFKDKNGTMIFEHDYIRTIYGRICEIIWFWSPAYCGWDLYPIANLDCPVPYYGSIWDPDYTIVVGNKFDNTELMEEHND